MLLEFVIGALSVSRLFATDTSATGSKAPHGANTTLGIQGAQFTLNGRPVFLLGISYYGALGASKETWLKDLARIKALQFNWIRVWATWNAFDFDVSAVDTLGHPHEPFLSKLVDLVGECDRNGLIVDITLSRGEGIGGEPLLQSLDAHKRAIETLLLSLKRYRNWYLDLANERNIRDKRFTSFDNLKELRGFARALDPALIVTASHGGDISHDELKKYIDVAKVDFIAPHRPRDAYSPAQTQDTRIFYMAKGGKTGACPLSGAVSARLWHMGTESLRFCRRCKSCENKWCGGLVLSQWRRAQSAEFPAASWFRFTRKGTV